MQPLRGDPNSPPPEETNAISQARGYQTPHCCHPRLSRHVHSARRCRGLSARQGRWWCRQHRQPNHISEAVDGRHITQIQQKEANHPARRPCGSCNHNIACNINPFTCSSYHTAFHRSCSGLTRDDAAAALGVSTQSPLEHKERRLERILRSRRRSNRAILDSPLVTR